MKSMIRINALTLSGYGNKTLPAMEAHGKRLDGTSQKRTIRNVAPIVYNTLDLEDAFNEHVSGCRMNKALKAPVLHAIMKFPTEITPSEKNQNSMMKLAIRFVNENYGGDAVFAARVDRDEEGEHIVDVFFSPKYVKHTKDKKGNPVETSWISTSKHGKELCEKHREEIMNRNDKNTFTNTPRSVGIALQSELVPFFARHGIKIDPKKPKGTYVNDRLDTETYKAREKLKQERIDFDKERAAHRAEMKAQKEQIAVIAKTASEAAASAVVAYLKDDLRRDQGGKWTSKPMPELKGIWRYIKPTMDRFADWYEQFRSRIEDLPEADRPQSHDLEDPRPDDDGPSM